jgi:hypothetical protein
LPFSSFASRQKKVSNAIKEEEEKKASIFHSWSREHVKYKYSRKDSLKTNLASSNAQKEGRRRVFTSFYFSFDALRHSSEIE